jgi:enediyne biosynthesis protein E3
MTIASSPLAFARRALLGISPGEATFSRRGFAAGAPSVRAHLERIGRTFLDGYNAALVLDDAGVLGARLRRGPKELCGFAFEGASMALALLDRLTPWSRDRFVRFERFVRGPAADHVYMAHVGAGWALARLRSPLARALSRLDPLLRWLAVDGYGFHEGYFNPQRTVALRLRPAGLCGYAGRAFDHGLGRSLWFVACAEVGRIADAAARFEPARRADLWSGVGLACAYAGGVGAATVVALAAAGAEYRAELAQGAAFAAEARLRAGNLGSDTSVACEILCAAPAIAAAAVTRAALEDLHSAAGVPAYEVWRRRIAAHFSTHLASQVAPTHPRS